MTTTTELQFAVPTVGAVSALLSQPGDPTGLFVLGHGSGSNMRVPLMAGLAASLAIHNVATLRFEYPYSDRPDFVPYSDMPQDSDEVLIATVRAALSCSADEMPNLRLFVGGHSISALMASIADAESPLAAAAIISLGFPCKGDAANTAHLVKTALPFLFVQGTQDTLGTESEIAEMATTLGNRATMRWIRGASHGFSVKGRDDADVIKEIAAHISDYIHSTERPAGNA